MSVTTQRVAALQLSTSAATRLLVAITAAAAALRFATLDLQALWYDEAVTVRLLELSLPDMLERIPDSESAPPLYYVVGWGWARAFGFGEIGVRSLSALLGTLAVPAFYLAARELARSNLVGIVVAALAAFNPILVWYSQEARGYALVTLLAALSVFFFARMRREEPDRQLLLGWALSSALALACHYFAVFLVLPEAVWLLVRLGRRAAIAVGAVAAVGAALLPLAIHQQSLDLASFIRSSSLIRREAQVFKQYVVGFEAPWELLSSSVALAVLAAGGLRALLGRPRLGILAASVLAASVLVLPLALAVADYDYVATRNVLIAWLPLMTVAAAGLARSRAGLLGATVVCAIGLAGVVGVALNPLWQRHNWRGPAESLGGARAPRAIVLTPAETGEIPFRLYHGGTQPFPAAGTVVREVAVITGPSRSGDQTNPPPPPRPPDPQLPGFESARKHYAENYTLIVFSNPQPVHVVPAQLDAARLAPKERASLLLERP
jgi:mannosyltransferase